MRNPKQEELEAINFVNTELEDLANRQQLLIAKAKDIVHRLRRTCNMPGYAELDGDTLSIWVKKQQTQAGVMEIPLVEEK